MNHITVIKSTAPPGFSTQPAAMTASRPIHQMLVPFSAAYLTAAFVTDLAYWRTAEVLWERFSVWLIAAGLIIAALAGIAAVIDLAFRKQRADWIRVFSFALAVLLSLLNVLVHSRDGYTAVVPTGLALSAMVVVVLMLTFSAGWALSHSTSGVRQ
jgi:uncharacterized membrane protein